MGVSLIPDVGFRVQRRVTIDGEVKEKTRMFSIKVPSVVKGRVQYRTASGRELTKIKKQAEKYDAELAEWQKVQKGDFDPFKVTKKNNTGIRGITRREHVAHGQVIDGFFVCVSDSNKKVYSRYYNIKTLGYDDAWTQAVSDLVKVKKLDEVTAAKILKAKPKNVRAAQTKTSK